MNVSTDTSAPATLHMNDGVAVITLNRPSVRNAFNAEMGVLLADHYRHCDVNDEVRAVVLTGTPPAFCAGADMSSRGDTFRPRDGNSFTSSGVAFKPWDVRKPVIAAVNGHAIGIGLTLALQCDIRLMARDAKYGIVQVRRGVMGDGLSHWTLPRIAGFANAAEILLTGRTFSGDEARAMGLCSRVAPNDEVLDAAMGIARDIATNVAPASAAASKRALWESMTSTREQIDALETELHLRLMRLPDAREGVEAFLGQRAPRWTGRAESIE
ncbi:MAG: enoyl-CoA hydratase/isomerase family protein [Actinobacteria bacterium]|nr:enoyl-CoA hydratase/isomerase family protein [Actinomycetota bacterium]